MENPHIDSFKNKLSNENEISAETKKISMTAKSGQVMHLLGQLII